MRVKIDCPQARGGVQFGEFVGLFVDEHDTALVMVRVDGYGLYLKGLHPSRVHFTSAQEEQESA